MDCKKTSDMLAELSAIVDCVPENQRPIAESLLRELSFMGDTLDALKEHVRENGAVELFKNGKQEMWRESPALKSYNATIKRYSDTCKAITGMVEPCEAVELAEQSLKDFCVQGAV